MTGAQSATVAREVPILFGAPMVRAILSGAKSQTRRILKPQPDFRGSAGCESDPDGWGWEDDMGQHVPVTEARIRWRAGDRMWVRETWWHPEPYSYGTLPSGEEINSPRFVSKTAPICFAADGDPPNCDNRHYGPGGLRGGWFAAPDPWAVWTKRPSIHMPRWASRITLDVLEVRVERLQSISEDDAIAEGVEVCDGLLDEVKLCQFAKEMGEPATESRVWYRALWETINGPCSWDANPFVSVTTFRRVTV